MWWFFSFTLALFWACYVASYLLTTQLRAVLRITYSAIKLYMLILGFGVVVVAIASLPYVEIVAASYPRETELPMLANTHNFLWFWAIWYAMVLGGMWFSKMLWFAMAVLVVMLEQPDVVRLLELGVTAIGASAAFHSPGFWLASWAARVIGWTASWATRNLGRFEMAWFKNMQIYQLENPKAPSPVYSFQGRGHIFWKSAVNTMDFISGKVKWTVGRKTD
ncbi:hypothetical protein F4779DRAFT_588513 [Xylariaceae sp. FL0662B]|nr:hypothetical protein F4779DRAFT_588513 [Xylariaceae sp. FL0662B]